MVDVITWHPFFGVSPAYNDYAEYYYEYPTIVEAIKTSAKAAGFNGEFRTIGNTWRTPLDYHPDHPWTYEEIVAAKYYARSILMHLGLDVTAGVDVDSRLLIIYSTVRNLATIMAGNTPTSLVVDIASPADNIASYGFTLPNNELLFALWTNGAAEEYDPGKNTTLTFPNISAEKVVGIDVLYGFEQELKTEVVNGDLVIRDLLVKDYPLILRLIP
jgi:hypothetical protein